MTNQVINIRGRKAAFIEAGAGDPLVWLHGFADVHGAAGELQPFHTALAKHRRVIALALPGVNGSDDLSGGSSADDIVFALLETLDTLGLPRFDLGGHCAGGWFAAEFAVRHPERVKTLALVGATGLFVPGHPAGDIFLHSQAQRGVDYSSLREMLFSSPDHPIAREFYPDGRAETEIEIRRYQMLRFGSLAGFRPPYFYNRALAGRLWRADMPARVIWGGLDRMVSAAHAEAYAQGLPGAGGSAHFIAGAGHAAHLEAPGEAARIVAELLQV